MAILNQEFSFDDVRYAISKRSDALSGKAMSYDVEMTFHGRPEKRQLDPGTILVRLDLPVVLRIFHGVWWMRKEVMTQILNENGGGAASVRQAWQEMLSLPKPGKPARGTRTHISEIQLTAPVYAWVGIASPRFHRSGGTEQVYLPCLARGTGGERSDYARLSHTYTLPA